MSADANRFAVMRDLGTAPSLQMLGASVEGATSLPPAHIALTPETARAVASELRARGMSSMVLATCHRLEIYWWGDARQCATVREVLGTHARGAADTLREPRSGDDALVHLMAVAGGVRSMRRGEPEILGQTRHAWQVAQWDGTSCPSLDTHVRAAIAAARHLRRLFAAEPTASIGEATADLLSRSLRDGTLAQETAGGVRVLLLGAGAVGRSVALAIASRRQAETWPAEVALAVANRTDVRAAALAQESGSTMVAWTEWPDRVAAADVVICAARSAHPLLTAADATRVTTQRRHPAMWVDLASPPNIAADVTHGAIVRRSERDLRATATDGEGASLIEAALQQELERFHAACARRAAWSSGSMARRATA